MCMIITLKNSAESNFQNIRMISFSYINGWGLFNILDVDFILKTWLLQEMMSLNILISLYIVIRQNKFSSDFVSEISAALP